MEDWAPLLFRSWGYPSLKAWGRRESLLSFSDCIWRYFIWRTLASLSRFLRHCTGPSPCQAKLNVGFGVRSNLELLRALGELQQRCTILKEENQMLVRPGEWGPPHQYPDHPINISSRREAPKGDIITYPTPLRPLHRIVKDLTVCLGSSLGPGKWKWVCGVLPTQSNSG